MTNTPATPPLFAAWSERPLAWICATLALTTLAWKTVGLHFVPGWDEMFGGVGSQYPRGGDGMAPAWVWAYLLVYGVLGSGATVAGLMITRRRGALTEPVGPGLAPLARLVGAFHALIGAHHAAWAVTGGAWGHLTLEQFDAPWLYVIGGVAGLGAGLHGVRLLTTAEGHPVHRVVRSKIAVDGVSLLTFTSVLLCFPMNLLGLERNLEMERLSWFVVFVGPALWLAADLTVSFRGRAD